jgi:hypothetical protein
VLVVGREHLFRESGNISNDEGIGRRAPANHLFQLWVLP